MKKHERVAVVKRYRTLGGGITFLYRRRGVWWRYTWSCLCGKTRSRRLAERVARRRAYRHATECRTVPKMYGWADGETRP